jgi:hypothetical protein
MRKILLAMAVVAIPAASFAQTQLDRMETVSEAMTEAMVVMMVREMEANGADAAPLMETLPDMVWDNAMRDAGRCILERYSDAIGDSGVETMLTNMEAYNAEIEALGENNVTISDLPEPEDMLPEGLSEQQSMEITQSCGMMELQLQRMKESGFSDAMMNAAQ